MMAGHPGFSEQQNEQNIAVFVDKIKTLQAELLKKDKIIAEYNTDRNVLRQNIRHMKDESSLRDRRKKVSRVDNYNQVPTTSEICKNTSSDNNEGAALCLKTDTNETVNVKNVSNDAYNSPLPTVLDSLPPVESPVMTASERLSWTSDAASDVDSSKTIVSFSDQKDSNTVCRECEERRTVKDPQVVKSFNVLYDRLAIAQRQIMALAQENNDLRKLTGDLQLQNKELQLEQSRFARRFASDPSRTNKDRGSIACPHCGELCSDSDFEKHMDSCR